MKILSKNTALVCLAIIIILLSTACKPESTQHKSEDHKSNYDKKYSSKEQKILQLKYEVVNGKQLILADSKPPLYHVVLEEIEKRAAQNDPAALYELGRRMTSPAEPPADNPHEAFKLLNQAAKLNDPDALAELQDIIHLGFMVLK